MPASAEAPNAGAALRLCRPRGLRELAPGL